MKFRGFHTDLRGPSHSWKGGWTLSPEPCWLYQSSWAVKDADKGAIVNYNNNNNNNNYYYYYYLLLLLLLRANWWVCPECIICRVLEVSNLCAGPVFCDFALHMPTFKFCRRKRLLLPEVCEGCAFLGAFLLFTLALDDPPANGSLSLAKQNNILSKP